MMYGSRSEWRIGSHSCCKFGAESQALRLTEWLGIRTSYLVFFFSPLNRWNWNINNCGKKGTVFFIMDSYINDNGNICSCWKPTWQQFLGLLILNSWNIFPNICCSFYFSLGVFYDEILWSCTISIVQHDRGLFSIF